MKKNKYLQLILFIILILLEVYINNISKVYIDIMGVVLLIYVINFNLSIKNIVIISLIADLIGFWYLGTHLIAIITVSILSDKLANYFNLLNTFQKIIFMYIIYALMALIILIIGKVIHNYFINMPGFFIELILIPFLYFLIDTLRKYNIRNEVMY